MRQTRLSIGCRDWQEMTGAIGATAAAVYLYLRTLMRSMQAAEITITVRELAEAVKIPSEAAESALRAICVSYMDRTDNTDGTITLCDRKEAAAQADMFRKRAARLLSRTPGQSGGQSGVLSVKSEELSVKQYETDFFMIYGGPSEQKEKSPHTPEKEKTLTENTASAQAQTPVREAELPADSLEAEYIDVIGAWPPSLRKAIQAEKDDVREAFYLCIRKRQADDGRTWSADQVRMTWLAARRIPEERRADSILAWGMGGWKTIRDCGSGVYFEKSTGRIVSLVRGTVEAKTGQSDFERQNSELAASLARNMRRD